MFESRVLRNVFGPERGEETGGCRQLHSYEFMICTPHYASVNQIKGNEMRSSCGTTGERRGV